MPNRKKVVIQARELSDMEVTRISLVKRGANRVPFRITKSNNGDKQMSGIDLGALFFQKKEKQPTVLGIVISNNVNASTYTEALKSAGLVVDHVTKSEDAENPSANLMLVKSDDIPEDAMVLKVDDNAAIVVADVKKGMETYPDATNFIENIQKAGFYPAFRTASEMLSATIGNIMYSEGDAEITKTAVSKALGDFKGYIDAVLSTVPENVFKAEAAIHSIKKGALIGTGIGDGSKTTKEVAEQNTKDAAKSKEQAEGEQKARAGDDKEKDTDTDTNADAGEGGDKGTEGEGGESTNTGGEGGEGTGDGDGEGSGTGSEGGESGKENSEGVDTNVSKSNDSQMTEVATALAALQKSVDVMAVSIDKKIDEAISPLKESIESVKSDVKKTDEAVKGTVHSEESEDQVSARVDKTESKEVFGSALDFGDMELS